MNSSAKQPTAPSVAGDRSPEVGAVVDRMLEVVPRTMRRIRSEMRVAGPGTLTVPQLRALLYIRRHPGCGLSALADHLGMTLPAASGLVERLVRADLVDRVTDPVERRRIQLRLTAAGTEHVGRAYLLVRSRLSAELATLSPAELSGLAEALEVLAGLGRDDGSVKTS